MFKQVRFILSLNKFKTIDLGKINPPKFCCFNKKMSGLRTRTSLGRSSLDFSNKLPSSPRALMKNDDTMPEMAVPEYQSRPVLVMEEELVPEQALEKELSRHGFTNPVNIVVQDGKKSQVPFVKAENEIGQPVYIQVDIPGAVTRQNENDSRFKPTKTAMMIPKEEKDMAYTQAGLSVSGVAMECQDGLCTIMHNDQMKAPAEQNYSLVYTKRKEKHVIKEEMLTVSYPIVRMSDLCANPVAVKKAIDCALRKMRNAALKACLCEIERVQKKFDCLCKEFKEVNCLREKVIKEFHRTITILEDSYDNCAKCPEKNACKLKEIAYNIEKRNAMFPCLMKSCKQMAALEQDIDQLLEVVKANKCRLEKKFKNLPCVYEPKEKKHCHQKCAWDDDSSSDEE